LVNSYLKGPIAAIVTAQLLVWSAKCEIQKLDEYCLKLIPYGITESDRLWLTILATTRDTVIVPTTNCLGYLKNVREDAGI